MFASPIIRLAIGVPVAAIVALSLFLLMERLIRVDEIKLGEDNSRSLRNIFAENNAAEQVRTTRRKAQRLDNADKPPPPPKLTATKQNIDLPTPSIQGAAPTEINFERVTGIDIGAVAVDDRDAQPIRPPQCSFPSRAASRGISGDCEVRFNVDVRGRPYGMDATCSDSIFIREAQRCVGNAEFAPKIVRGQPAERRNVVYPLNFQLQD